MLQAIRGLAAVFGLVGVLFLTGAVVSPSPADAAGPDTAPATIKLASAVFPLPSELDEAVLCATCHTEHQGPVFDLTRMADERCQACHVAKFSSLSDGHPDFHDFPYTRRTRIIFDHRSHFGRHFPEAGAGKAPASCNACHETDPTGTLMLAKSFAVTCKDCHIGQITGAQRAVGPKGIGVLSVPGLDIETLRERDVAIGEWPEFSEAGIVPVMELLLGVDDRYAKDLKVLQSMDLLDLTEASEDELAAVERIAWAVKSLLCDLAVHGIGDLSGRIERAVRLPLDDVARAHGRVPAAGRGRQCPGRLVPEHHQRDSNAPRWRANSLAGRRR